jgi:hypothetical protein
MVNVAWPHEQAYLAILFALKMVNVMARVG